MDMQVEVIGKHVDITDALRKHAYDKVSKFQRYYSSVSTIQVVIEGGVGHVPSVEIIARAEHNKVFVATESGVDIYAAIDMAAHKLERQLTKMKTKERDNKHIGGAAAASPSESDEEVIE
ncbi:MAG: ribosome-associated translation inhibitor RaiA [Sedimentisphaerales bacterium]|nr:ribosome-associated translation inhibitor RaiA [Sedimentisphaerales bacterium]